MLRVILMFISLFSVSLSGGHDNNDERQFSCAECFPELSSPQNATKCWERASAADLNKKIVINVVPCTGLCYRTYDLSKFSGQIVSRGCLSRDQLKDNTANKCGPFGPGGNYQCTCDSRSDVKPEGKGARLCNDVLQCHQCEDCPETQSPGEEDFCDIEELSGNAVVCNIEVKGGKVYRGCMGLNHGHEVVPCDDFDGSRARICSCYKHGCNGAGLKVSKSNSNSFEHDETKYKLKESRTPTDSGHVKWKGTRDFMTILIVLNLNLFY